MSRTRAIRAGAWSVALQVVRLGIQAGVFLLFARYLTLKEVGAYSFAYAFVQVIQAFVRTGVMEVFVAAPRTDRAFVAAANMSSIIIGVLSAVFIATVGIVTQVFNGSSPWIFLFLATVPLIDSLGIVPEAILRKNLEFSSITLRTTAGLTVAAAICLLLGYLGWRASALVAFNIATSLISTLIAMFIVRRNISFTSVHWPDVKSIIGPSFHVSLSTFASGIVVPASQIALGAFAGPAALGAYAIAQRILSLINSVLVDPVRVAALPVLSKVKGDAGRRSALIEVLSLCATIISPICLGLAAVSPVLLTLALGENGKIAAPIFMVLALHFVPLTISMASSQLLLVQNKSKEVLKYSSSLAVLGVLTAILTSPFGPIATAAGYVLRAYVLTPMALRQVDKFGGVAPMVILKAIYRPVICAAAMELLILGMERFVIPADVGALPRLLILILCGSATYLLLIALFGRHHLNLMTKIIRDMVQFKSTPKISSNPGI